jgi:hypothetical protein
VEGCHAITWSKFGDKGANGVDCAGEIIAAVVGVGFPRFISVRYYAWFSGPRDLFGCIRLVKREKDPI